MSSVDEYSVVISHISKKFGDFQAVKDIDFKIKKGEMFGLLGPNGAGKTTTLNMILGLLTPTTGKITIEGLDNSKYGEQIKQMIGFMTQETVVEGYLTARQNLQIFAELYHIPKERIPGKIEHALKEANLTDFGDVAAGTFSGGMQRRLNLVKSMIQEPKILILDEPTTGLDVQSRLKMWEEIRRLNREGITIILTTQYLEEADALCDRIAIIDHGAVKAIGTAQELKKIVAKGNILSITASETDLVKISKILKSKLGYEFKQNGEKIEVPVESKQLAHLVKVAQLLDKEDVEIHTISLNLPTLDDVFIKLTGESIRDSTAQQKSDITRVRMSGGR